MSHVQPHESGVTVAHCTAIEETLAAHNAFLFIRPTEMDSTVLIDAGFATKNMDIHDKSSNWGPMAGMVPCDPFFSKKNEGTANAQPHYHDHGAAHPVTLKIDRALETQMVTRTKMSASKVGYTLSGRDVAPGTAHPNRRFYEASPPAKSTVIHFCIDEAGNVSWVKWDDPARKERGKAIPLWVWAYSIQGVLKPVTGDYDMWLVAPHASMWWKHQQSEAMEDPEGHGTSTASRFTKDLLDAMNDACKRRAPRTNQVFNHGAEAQNYGFTQALDPKLAMFTPAGTSRMVDIWEMPRVLADLQKKGYLAIYNKRYVDLDPRLMGTSTIKPLARLNSLQKRRVASATSGGGMGAIYEQAYLDTEIARVRKTELMRGVAWKAVDRLRFREALKELRELERTQSPATGSAAAKPKYGTKEWAERPGRPLAQARLNLLRAAVRLGVEPARITRLGDELVAIMSAVGERLDFLKDEDFPAGIRKLGDMAQQLLAGMQRSSVAATTGVGESDPSLVFAWARENAMTLEQFSAALEDLGKPAIPLP